MDKKYKDQNLNSKIIFLTFNKRNEILISKKIVLKEVTSVEREALFTLLLVYLNSLIIQLSTKGILFDWKDEDTRQRTITELIKYIRDSLCHLESDKNFNNSNFYRFNTHLGCQGAPEIDKKYPDDAAIFSGDTYILYWRHIVRLFIEISKKIGKDINTKDYFVNCSS
jgi:hypothetical protein